MDINLIRNATMVITYAGVTFLTDPMFSPKDEMDPFAGIARNPTTELLTPIDSIINGIQGVIVSHLHPDHFDPAASSALPKDLPLLCQPGDETQLTETGFLNVTPVDGSHTWQGITITRTGGMHGEGEILKMMGNVSGFVFQAENEPTLYWVGDSIWWDEVAEVINRFSPDVIITHSGGATIPGYDPIIMNGEQTLAVAHAAPAAKIVAIHMEALDHCPVGRSELRKLAGESNVSPTRLLIPADGETISF